MTDVPYRFTKNQIADAVAFAAAEQSALIRKIMRERRETDDMKRIRCDVVRKYRAQLKAAFRLLEEMQFTEVVVEYEA